MLSWLATLVYIIFNSLYSELVGNINLCFINVANIHVKLCFEFVGNMKLCIQFADNIKLCIEHVGNIKLHIKHVGASKVYIKMFGSIDNYPELVETIKLYMSCIVIYIYIELVEDIQSYILN